MNKVEQLLKDLGVELTDEQKMKVDEFNKTTQDEINRIVVENKNKAKNSVFKAFDVKNIDELKESFAKVAKEKEEVLDEKTKESEFMAMIKDLNVKLDKLSDANSELKEKTNTQEQIQLLQAEGFSRDKAEVMRKALSPFVSDDKSFKDVIKEQKDSGLFKSNFENAKESLKEGTMSIQKNEEGIEVTPELNEQINKAFGIDGNNSNNNN